MTRGAAALRAGVCCGDGAATNGRPDGQRDGCWCTTAVGEAAAARCSRPAPAPRPLSPPRSHPAAPAGGRTRGWHPAVAELEPRRCVRTTGPVLPVAAGVGAGSRGWSGSRGGADRALLVSKALSRQLLRASDLVKPRTKAGGAGAVPFRERGRGPGAWPRVPRSPSPWHGAGSSFSPSPPLARAEPPLAMAPQAGELRAGPRPRPAPRAVRGGCWWRPLHLSKAGLSPPGCRGESFQSHCV